jgi:hypothetical protein
MVAGWNDDAGRGWSPYGLAARVAAAEARAQAELDTAVADLAIAEGLRLDDRTRLDIEAMLAALVTTTGSTLRRHAARLLADRDIDGVAALRPVADLMPRLLAAGLLRDRALVAALVGRARHDRIAAALPLAAVEGDAPGLLIRLAGAADGDIADAALALLGLDGRRREAWERAEPASADLPAAIHAELVWLVAAALRMEAAGAVVTCAADRALAEATTRLLADQQPSEQADAVALALAAAIDPADDDLPPLLVAAIDDRRLDLFTALVAHALDIAMPEMRAIVVDPVGDRLWLTLRALSLGRTALARIALALADADPRRDIDAFAVQLDAIAAIPAAEAAAVLAPLALPPAFHAAIRTVGQRPRW